LCRRDAGANHFAMIVIVFTGGTISMRIDPSVGAPVPTTAGAQLLQTAPGIERIAPLEIDDWATMPATHFTVDHLWSLRSRIAFHVDRPDVTGVIVTQGTDTLEETAYLVGRSISTPKPIVFTGAMRTADDLGWDGPSNLIDSVRVAADPTARGHGVLVVCNSRIFTARDVTKVDTRLPDAFDSPGIGPIGEVDGDRVVFRRQVPALAILNPPSLAAPVDIVYAYVGCDGRLVDAARAHGVGLVVAALGRGNTNPPFFEAVQRWLAADKPVVVSTRVVRGRVGPTYGFRGGGRTLADAGAIFAGSRRPQQARIDLMLGLGAGLRGPALAAMFEE
jgi:L-asparaginase